MMTYLRLNKIQHAAKVAGIIAMLFLLPGCRKDLSPLINFKEVSSNPPCVISVWPAVQAGNKKYKMSEKRAFQFVRDVEAQLTRFRGRYRSVKANKKEPPAICKKLLWHKGAIPKSNYLSCMTRWGERSNYSCVKKDTYVVGAIITSTSGTAEILVVRLNNRNKRANKKPYRVRGKNLKTLSKKIGKSISRAVWATKDRKRNNFPKENPEISFETPNSVP